MGGLVSDPVVGRILLGFAAAVPVAAYSGALFVAVMSAIWMNQAPGAVGSPATAVGAMLLTVMLVGTVLLPLAFLAGLPALAVAWWLIRMRGAQSKWWFVAVGMLASVAVVWLVLPIFHPLARESHDPSWPGILDAGVAGLMALAPAGALAGWVFWRIGAGTRFAKS